MTGTSVSTPTVVASAAGLVVPNKATATATHQQLYDLCGFVVCLAAVDFLNKPHRSPGNHDQRAMPDRIKQHQQHAPKQISFSGNNGKQNDQHRR